MRLYAAIPLTIGLFGGAVQAETPVIATVTYPLAYFAEELSGGSAEVLFPVPGDRDPALWRPGIKDIAAIQKADVIALNGAGYAKWVSKASLPRRRMVDTSKSFRDQFIKTETVTHSHGADGAHSHEGVATYTWLDFSLAAEQAAALGRAMEKAGLDVQIAELEANLSALHTAAGALSDGNGPAIIASHPRYQYFARAYDLSISALDWDAGAMPSAQQIADLEAKIAETGARIFLWEAAPSEDALSAVGALGVEQVVFPPLATRPAEGDFIAQMTASIKALGEAIERATP